MNRRLSRRRRTSTAIGTAERSNGRIGFYDDGKGERALVDYPSSGGAGRKRRRMSDFAVSGKRGSYTLVGSDIDDDDNYVKESALTAPQRLLIFRASGDQPVSPKRILSFHPKPRFKDIQTDMENVQRVISDVEANTAKVARLRRLLAQYNQTRERTLSEMQNQIETSLRPAIASLESSKRSIYPAFRETKEHRSLIDDACKQVELASYDLQSRSDGAVISAREKLLSAVGTLRKNVSASRKAESFRIVIAIIVVAVAFSLTR